MEDSFTQKLKAYFTGKQTNPKVGKPAAQPVLQNQDSQQKLKESLQNAFGTPKTSMVQPQEPQIDEETLAQLLALRNLNGRNNG